MQDGIEKLVDEIDLLHTDLKFIMTISRCEDDRRVAIYTSCCKGRNVSLVNAAWN